MIKTTSIAACYMSAIGLGLVGADPLWRSVCQQDPAASLPFCDDRLSVEERVDDYVGRIPIVQQIAMMGNLAAGYDPLGIPPYQWWSEGLHGPLEPCVEWNNRTRCPTSFPCPSGLGNAFNSTLYRKIGEAIGKEGKAISDLRKHDHSIGDGITYWSPNVNLQRDPRWGRNQEVPGEDPFLTSQYARHFIQGLQWGEDDEHGEKLQVAPCCKHYVANSLESWKGHTRHNFNAIVSEADLNDYYFKPFEECVRSGAVGFMCSYNSVNGEPSCINEDLLKSTLRDKWNFDGYLVTDCGALVDTIDGHGAAINPADASAKSKRASVDINCGDTFQKGLLNAYKAGLVRDSTIQESFRRMARVQFRLGLFDVKQFHPQQALDTVGSHSHLSLEAARQSIVLLKNDNGVLPLNPEHRIALIGPHIHGRGVFLSNYHGEACPYANSSPNKCLQSPFEAFMKVSNQGINGIEACHVADLDLDEISEAVHIASLVDRVVLLVGLNQSQEREEKDRTQTLLPGLQQTLIQEILEVAANRTTVVLIHGGSCSLGDDVIQRTQSIVSASYGGDRASEAITDILYGKYNPTGKLAATIYPPSFVDDIPLTEMGMSEGPGRTHMYYTGVPEFPFGHGLSYSNWALEWVQSSIGAFEHLILNPSDPPLQISVNVTNLGPMSGQQTVLLFLRPAERSRIRQKLIGFQGTTILEVGRSEILVFHIDYQDATTWNMERRMPMAKPGLYHIEATTSTTSATNPIFLASDHIVERETHGVFKEEAPRSS